MNLEPLNVGMKSAALVPGRLALGSTMVFHGYSKLKKGAPEPTGQFFESLGIKPGKFWAVATGVAEVMAGVTAILGIGSRIGALAVLVTQSLAVGKVHAKNGFDATKGGYEWNLALMGIAAGLLLAGPGVVSAHEGLEHALQRKAKKRLYLFGPAKKSVKWVKLIK